MSQHIITGKQGANMLKGVPDPVRYRLSGAWITYCQALKVQVSDVEELAAQGEILEAFPLLSIRLAGTGTGATAAARPASAPFVRVAPVATSGLTAGLLPAMQGGEAALPFQSAASDAPTTGLEAVAPSLVLRDRPAYAAKKFRRFRPLVPPRVVLRQLQQLGAVNTRCRLSICLEALLQEAFQ